MSRYEVGDKVRYVNAARALRSGHTEIYGKRMTIEQALCFGRYAASYHEGSLFGPICLIIIRSRDVEFIKSPGDEFLQGLADEKADAENPPEYPPTANNGVDAKAPPDREPCVQPPLPVQAEPAIEEQKKKERKKPVFNLTCQQCGAKFTAAGPRAKYCPECKGKRFMVGDCPVKIKQKTPQPLPERGDPNEYAENQIANTIAEHDAQLIKNRGGGVEDLFAQEGNPDGKE